jgi:hypothetical protein
MVIDGKVYDITPYAEYHPGGLPQLMRGAGQDATAVIAAVHAWVNIPSLIAPLLLGELAAPPSAGAAGARSPSSSHSPSSFAGGWLGPVSPLGLPPNTPFPLLPDPAAFDRALHQAGAPHGAAAGVRDQRKVFIWHGKGAVLVAWPAGAARLTGLGVWVDAGAGGGSTPPPPPPHPLGPGTPAAAALALAARSGARTHLLVDGTRVPGTLLPGLIADVARAAAALADGGNGTVTLLVAQQEHAAAAALASSISADDGLQVLAGPDGLVTAPFLATLTKRGRFPRADAGVLVLVAPGPGTGLRRGAREFGAGAGAGAAEGAAAFAGVDDDDDERAMSAPGVVGGGGTTTSASSSSSSSSWTAAVDAVLRESYYAAGNCLLLGTRPEEGDGGDEEAMR